MDVSTDRNDIDSWKEVTLIYNSALKQISTKLEILNDEFQHVHRYNPIEHIKSRIKTPESIVKKLKKHGYESTIGIPRWATHLLSVFFLPLFIYVDKCQLWTADLWDGKDKAQFTNHFPCKPTGAMTELTCRN